MPVKRCFRGQQSKGTISHDTESNEFNKNETTKTTKKMLELTMSVANFG